MKTMIVGGFFAQNGASLSETVEEICTQWTALDKHTEYINGGSYQDLENIIDKIQKIKYDVVFWMPEMDKPRQIERPKEDSIIIGRNYGETDPLKMMDKAAQYDYDFIMDISNDAKPCFRIVDCLGNIWYKGADLIDCVKSLYIRISFLYRSLNPKMNAKETLNLKALNEPELEKYVNNMIQEHKQDKHIRLELSCKKHRNFYASKKMRNKTIFNNKMMIPVQESFGVIYYQGNIKPNKNTPIQISLYEHFPCIKYIVHCNDYVEGAQTTSHSYFDDTYSMVDDILLTVSRSPNYLDAFQDFYAVNIKNNGCLVMGKSIKDLKKAKFTNRNIGECV